MVLSCGSSSSAFVLLDVPKAAGSKACLISQPCAWEVRSRALHLGAYCSMLSLAAGSPLPDLLLLGLIVRICLGGNLSKRMASALAPYACENIGLEASRRQWKPVEHSSLVLIFFLFPSPPLQWQDVSKSCHFNQLFKIIYLSILVKLSTERSVKFHIKLIGF